MSSPRWVVTVIDPATDKPRLWDTYRERERAASVAEMLLRYGFFVQLKHTDEDDRKAAEIERQASP